MERTVDEIMNETQQFESQYAINIWVENLTVPDLISQLRKYSLTRRGSGIWIMDSAEILS